MTSYAELEAIGVLSSKPTQVSNLITSVVGANLTCLIKLGETSGTTAFDSTTTAANGTYTGTYTLDQPGVGDGTRSTSFAGGRVSLAGAPITAINSVWSWSLGSMGIWYKMSGVGVWTDTASRFMCEIGADANNRVIIGKQSTNNSLQITSFFGGTQKGVFPTSQTSTAWQMALITWDKAGDAVKGYLNGAQVGSTQTGLGTGTGTLASGFSAIADFTSAGSANTHSGFLAYFFLANAALTPTQAAALVPTPYLV